MGEIRAKTDGAEPEMPVPKLRLDEAAILDLLSAKHGNGKWFFWRQFRDRTGFACQRTIDGLAVAKYSSDSYRVIAYEVKVDRQDFLSDVRQPEKRGAFMDQTNQFYYVTPWELVEKNEIPEGCGLIWVTKNGAKLRLQREAPFRNPDLRLSVPDAVAMIAAETPAHKGPELFCKFRGKDVTEDDLRKILEENKGVFLSTEECNAIDRARRMSEFTEDKAAQLEVLKRVLGEELGLGWFIGYQETPERFEKDLRFRIEQLRANQIPLHVTNAVRNLKNTIVHLEDQIGRHNGRMSEAIRRQVVEMRREERQEQTGSPDLPLALE